MALHSHLPSGRHHTEVSSKIEAPAWEAKRDVQIVHAHHTVTLTFRIEPSTVTGPAE